MHNVLLVDDEPGAIKSIRYAVNWEQYGFTIAGVAANGQMALDMFSVRSYSLVITDIRMPVMDGLRLIAEIRAASDVPIVIMTGFEEFEDARTALKLGVRDYLLKPPETADVEQMLERLRQELLGRSGSRQEQLEARERAGRLVEVPVQPEALSTATMPVTQPGRAAAVVRQWAEQRYADNLSMRGLASKLYMNAAYLGQLFKAETGMGFNDYLLRIRMEKAKQLLDSTDLKVYEIASAVGYNDMDWFYTKFKHYTGVNPSEYKLQQHRKG